MRSVIYQTDLYFQSFRMSNVMSHKSATKAVNTIYITYILHILSIVRMRIQILAVITLDPYFCISFLFRQISLIIHILH